MTLVLRRRAPAGAAAPAGGRGGAGGGAPQVPWRRTRRQHIGGRRWSHGADVILHDLVLDADQLLVASAKSPSIRRAIFSRTALMRQCAMATAFSSSTSQRRVNALENDAKVYSRLTWSDDGTGLAVLKGVDVDKMRERDNTLVVHPRSKLRSAMLRVGR